MRFTGALGVATAAVMMVALAGCAGTASEGDGAETGVASFEDSPLGEYLSAAWGTNVSPEEQQKHLDEQRRAVEEFIAACMAEQGFEYKTAPLETSVDTGSADEAGWEPEKREWVQEYGYGIVKNPYFAIDNAYVDPNQEYIDSLSEDESAAYVDALYGPASDESEIAQDGEYEYRWQDAGCQGAATHEVEGEDVWQLDEFAELREKMDNLWTETLTSPEFVELDSSWAACMTDAGEPGFATQSEAFESISSQHSELYDAAFDAAPTGNAESTDSPVDPNESPEMVTLGEREIELALQDLECREKTEYAATSLKIQFAMERQFIAENKAELEAFKAAAEQSE